MRWILFVILVYVATLAQTTLSQLLVIHTGWAGAVVPDLLACMAAFLAMRLRQNSDVAIACWSLGLALDLTSSGGPALGLMSLTYMAAGWIILKLREGFFRDRISSQIVTTIIFCIVAHTLYLTLQVMLLWRFAGYGTMLLEAMMVAIYSAAAAPLVQRALAPAERWLISPAAGRQGRDR